MKIARVISAALLVLAASVEGLTAQFQFDDTEILASTRPEAWAMKYFTSLTLLTGYGPIASREEGWIDLGLEVVEFPFLSEEERKVGFNGEKVEDLNNAEEGPLPVFNKSVVSRISRSNLRQSGSRRSANEGWTTIHCAPQSAITCSSSGRGCLSHRGTAMPPARQIAHCVPT